MHNVEYMSNNAQLSRALLHNDRRYINAYMGLMNKDRDIAIEAIEELSRQTGLKPSALATKAGLVASTLNRPLRLYKAGEKNYEISYITLTKISQYAGYESYEDFIISWLYKPKQEIITQQYDTLGLLNAIGILFSILIVKKTISKGELEEVIKSHISHFKRRNLSGAKVVTEELLGVLNLQPYQSMLPKEQKPLRHLPE